MATNVTVKKGAVQLPDELRNRFGIEDGTVLLAEASQDGILLRPLDTEVVDGFEIEIYTPERKAEFLLNNVFTADEYASAREEVERMGLDPDAIPHRKPTA